MNVAKVFFYLNNILLSFIGTRKGLVKSAFQLARYVTETYTQSAGLIQRRNLQIKLVDNEVSEDMYEAEDTWGSRAKSQLTTQTRQVGHYQAAPTTLFKKLDNPKKRKNAKADSTKAQPKTSRQTIRQTFANIKNIENK